MAIPKHYRFVQEHKDSYEMHDTRDEKHFHIAKKDLNKSMHKQITSVQKLWDGGDVRRSGLLGTQNKVDQELEDIRHPNLNPRITGTGDVRTPEQKARAAEYERTGIIPPVHPTTNVAGGDEGYAQGGEVRKMAFGGISAEERAQLAQNMGLNKPVVNSTDPNVMAQQQQDEQRAALMASLPKAPADLSVEGNQVVQAPAPVDVGQIATAPQSAQPAATTPGAAAPTSQTDVLGEYSKATDLAKAGIAEQAGAEATRAQAQAKMYQDQQNDLVKLAASHDTRMKAMNDRSNDLYNNIVNQKIDPDKYWKNHSKITAGLGILLSGIGAGLQKSTTNLALDNINSGIEKEIDAQKSNLNTKNNLYKMNLEQVHNEAEAYAMTKSDLLTMTAAKANQIAAQSGTAEAEARKNLLLAKLGTDQAQLHQQLATAGVARQAYTEGIPAAAVTYLHPDQQKRMVPLPNGQMADAGSDKSAENVKETIAPVMEARASLNRLEQISSVYAHIRGTPAGAAAEAEAANLTNLLQNMAQQKRFSDDAVEYQMKKFSNPTDISEILTNGAATKQMQKILDSKVDSVYRANVPAYSLQKGKQAKIPFKKND